MATSYRCPTCRSSNCMWNEEEEDSLVNSNLRLGNGKTWGDFFLLKAIHLNNKTTAGLTFVLQLEERQVGQR